MNLFWQNKNQYVHKVKPPKMKPRDEKGYKSFLINTQIAIEKVLLDIWIERVLHENNEEDI